MTDDVEDYAKAQIQMICDQEAVRKSKIRVMPDVHPGKVGPIGLTMTIGEKLIPQLLGIDIGCGVICVRLKEKRMEYQKLEKVIRDRIPAGFAIRENAHYLARILILQNCTATNMCRKKKTGWRWGVLAEAIILLK